MPCFFLLFVAGKSQGKRPRAVCSHAAYAAAGMVTCCIVDGPLRSVVFALFCSGLVLRMYDEFTVACCFLEAASSREQACCTAMVMVILPSCCRWTESRGYLELHYVYLFRRPCMHVEKR